MDIFYFKINNIWSLLIMGLIVYFFIHLTREINRERGNKEKFWYLQISLSKEDTLIQFLFLLFLSFFWIVILIFNKYFLEGILSLNIILFLVSIVGLIIAYSFKAIYVMMGSLIGLITWWILQVSKWIEIYNIKNISLFTSLIFIFVVLYLLGRVYEKEIKFKRFSIVYLISSILSIAIIVFFLSTEPGLRTLEEMTKGNYFFNSWQITFFLFLFLVFIIGILKYAFSKNLIFKLEAIAITMLVFVFLVISLLPQQQIFILQKNYYGFYSSSKLSQIGILWAIFFNILIFLKLIGIIFLGYLEQENWLVDFGVFLLFILILFKYLDWFYSFLDKSIFFIGTGILLFIIGWFMEKGKRRLLFNIKKETINQN